MLKVVHHGFDKLDVAFKGYLPADVVAELEEGRTEAEKRRGPVSRIIGPGLVEAMVADHGMRGGYRYTCDTGLAGENWFFKRQQSPSEWGIYASVHSSALIVASLDETFDRLFRRLEAFGATIGDAAVGRVDYAMDFRADDLTLKLDRFVAHPRAKRRPYWGEAANQDPNRPSAVIAGRHLESVTVGKLPGYQVIVYDKTREARSANKPHWFKVWGIAPDDASARVWRVELRAGKRELKDRWNLRSPADVRNAIADVFLALLKSVRYVADDPLDTNVTRQPLHPLWIEAERIVGSALLDHRAGLTAGQLYAIERDKARLEHLRQIMGNAAGLAAAEGWSDAEVRQRLAREVAVALNARIYREDRAFRRALEHARRKYPGALNV